ncbi:MAG TPA: ribonuclease HII [Gemmatimonadales bacterium]|jgi:ribonuclease HII
MPPLRHERAAWATGYLLIGIDEVGRGPLAGPVVAAAVCFPKDHAGIRGVRDSKAVSDPEERVQLVARIRRDALAFGLGAASVREIARINIRRATALAMRRALLRCRASLGAAEAVVLIDGLPMLELGEQHQALVKGDAHCHAIAAASIIAKVARDRLMHALAARRPGYGWHTNVGYATREHVAALHAQGLTPHHRQLFCDTALGQRGLFDKSAPEVNAPHRR